VYQQQLIHDGAPSSAPWQYQRHFKTHFTNITTCNTHISKARKSSIIRHTNKRLQASAAKKLKTPLFWAITKRVVVISYRRFGTTYRSHLQGSGTRSFWIPEPAAL